MFLNDIVKGGVEGLIGSVTNVFDTFIRTDDEKAQFKIKMAELRAEQTNKLVAQLQILTKEQANIIIAEAKGGSWMQRNWRPILMLTIVAIVANNYIIVPYLSMFTDKITALELPDKLWNLMTLGVSGYIGGRTIEKSITNWKGGKK